MKKIRINVNPFLATIIGSLGAIGMYKYKFKGKSIIDGLLYIPVVIPEIVLGISLLTIFAKVNIPRGMLTLILSHVTFCVPFVIFNVRARLSGYDNSIEEAAKTYKLDCYHFNANKKMIIKLIFQKIGLSRYLSWQNNWIPKPSFS